MNEGEMEIVRRKGMRTGYTTGSCAAAAARAATITLISGKPVEAVTIRLPIGKDATFRMHSCEFREDSVRCSVIKDAGDDPDVTHLAEIAATVWWQPAPGIDLRGGVGVGRVTLPGLGLEVGGPAINPVPRRMILSGVGAAAAGLLERAFYVERASSASQVCCPLSQADTAHAPYFSMVVIPSAAAGRR